MSGRGPHVLRVDCHARIVEGEKVVMGYDVSTPAGELPPSVVIDLLEPVILAARREADPKAGASFAPMGAALATVTVYERTLVDNGLSTYYADLSVVDESVDVDQLARALGNVLAELRSRAGQP